jgi:hypothetical protein
MHPFHSKSYLDGLSNNGKPVANLQVGWRLLQRPIAGSGCFDGVGSWPYTWITGQQEIESLRQDYPDLVTICAVTQPGYLPPRDGVDNILLKHHFTYDPRLPRRPLSTRSALRLRKAFAVSAFEVATDTTTKRGMARELIQLYRLQNERRGITGFFQSLTDRHFTSVAGLESGRYFKVTTGGITGAMACGVVYQDQLQILHIAISEEGLRQNASYVLMDGLMGLADETRATLLTGGMPDSARASLHTFKQKWSNRLAPVYLLRIVNDPIRYRALCGTADRGGFFPAYRQPKPEPTAEGAK